MYKCKIEQFEGPLDLLLQLIENEELNISEISLSKIADQYVEHVNVNTIDANELSDFLLIAAKLLLAKSRYLLPFLNTEDDEDIGDLEQRLKIYKEFLDASKVIDELYRSGNTGYVPKFQILNFKFQKNIKCQISNVQKDGKEGEEGIEGKEKKKGGQGDDNFFPPRKISKDDLKRAFEDILDNLKPQERLEEERIQRVVSVQEKLDEIKSFVLKQIKIDFNNLIVGAGDKEEVIISFLAILELVKQRVVVVEQSEQFSDITIQRIVKGY